MEDLFGNDTPVIERKPGQEKMLVRWARFSNYRPAERGSSRRCGTCAHLFIKKYGKKYYKCELLGLKNSPATDIRLRHVCDHYKPEEE